MQPDRFIAHVNQSCPELDPDVVHQATLITIETLCEQLPLKQTQHMASQLPDELARAVKAGGDRADTTDVPLALADFYDKLAFRTELDAEETRALAQGVARTLASALSVGEAEEVALDLPPDLDQLLKQ